MKSLELAHALQSEGFFNSESEDLDERVQKYSKDHDRLNALWDAAFAEASDADDAADGFQRLCNRLAITDENMHPDTVPAPITCK